MTDPGTVTTRTDGHVLIAEVDRQEKLNALTPEIFEGITQAMADLEADVDLRAMVLCFAGKHSSAGLELTRFLGPGADYYDNYDYNDPRPDPFALRRRCKKPVILAVQGITYTALIEIMLAQDIVIAADDCRFRQMEPSRGIAVLGGGHARYIDRAGWGNAMYHLWMCEEFSSERAKEIGFVQEVVPAGQQIDRAIEVAKVISKGAPLAVQEMKRASAIFVDRGESTSLEAIERLRIVTSNSEDAREGVQSFVERRDAVFKGR